MAKYLICPGTVRARDGDIHFIDARQLIDLYRVDPKDCIIKPSGFKVIGREKTKDLIELHPNTRGDYSTPQSTPIGALHCFII